MFISTRKKRSTDFEKAKEVIMKEFFSSSSQRRAINKAARQSVIEQKALVDKYRKIKSK